MYTVRPLQAKVVITCLPNCMYKTKSYFNENELNFDSDLVTNMENLSLGELEDLNKQQNKQFRRLERLINKSNELCEDLRLDDLVIQSSKSESTLNEIYEKQEALFKKIDALSLKLNNVCQEMKFNNLIGDFKTLSINTSKKQRQKFQVDQNKFKNIIRIKNKVLTDRNVEDLVIYVNPLKVPLDLLNYFDLLSQKCKSFVKFYIHSSICNELQNNFELENRLLSIGELFEDLKLGVNDSRVSYDFGFTFIWRKTENTDPELKFSNGTVVAGENKIIETFNQLLPQQIQLAKNNLKQNFESSPLFKVLNSF